MKKKKWLVYIILITMSLGTNQKVYATEVSANGILAQTPAEDGQAQKKRVTVVIDPGHGGDPAVDETNGGAYYQEVYEKDLNLTVANAMAEELNQYKGVDVFLTRESDTAMDLEERVDFAAAKQADVLIAIHFNASDEHLFYGSEVWTSMFGKNYATGYGLGTCFLNHFEEEGFLRRGVKTREGKNGQDYYGLIRHGVDKNIPTIIVEHAYLDDAQDYEKIDSQMKLIGLGKEDAAAVADYYGLNKETQPENITPTIEVPVLDTPVKPDLTPPENVMLTLNEYDKATGEANVTITATENESRILYYGYSLDGGETYCRLIPWDSEEGTKEVSLPVGREFSGTITAVVYNTFNEDGVSSPVTIEPEQTEKVSPDSEKKYDLADVYDIPVSGNKTEAAPIQPQQETSAPSVYQIILIVLVVLFALLSGALLALGLAVSARNRRIKRRHRKQ